MYRFLNSICFTDWPIGIKYNDMYSGWFPQSCSNWLKPSLLPLSAVARKRPFNSILRKSNLSTTKCKNLKSSHDVLCFLWKSFLKYSCIKISTTSTVSRTCIALNHSHFLNFYVTKLGVWTSLTISWKDFLRYSSQLPIMLCDSVRLIKDFLLSLG